MSSDLTGHTGKAEFSEVQCVLYIYQKSRTDITLIVQFVIIIKMMRYSSVVPWMNNIWPNGDKKDGTFLLAIE